MAFFDKFRKKDKKEQNAETSEPVEAAGETQDPSESSGPGEAAEVSEPSQEPSQTGNDISPVPPLFLTVEEPESEPESEAVLNSSEDSLFTEDLLSLEIPQARGDGNGDHLKEETLIVSEDSDAEETPEAPDNVSDNLLEASGVETTGDSPEEEEKPEEDQGSMGESQETEPESVFRPEPPQKPETVKKTGARKSPAKITPMSEFVVRMDSGSRRDPAPPQPPQGEARPAAAAKLKNKIQKPARTTPAGVGRSKAAARPGKPDLAATVPRGSKPASGVNRGLGGKRAWIPLTAAVVAGLLAGGGLVTAWYAWGPGRQRLVRIEARAEKEITRLKTELENEKMAHMNVRTGQKRLFELLNDFYKDWSRSPAKPDYFKPARGSLVVYWVDGMVWRSYHVYQAQGAKGAMKLINESPQKKNFYYFKKLSPGTWRFAVSALNKEGKETPMSEELTVKMP